MGNINKQLQEAITLYNTERPVELLPWIKDHYPEGVDQRVLLTLTALHADRVAYRLQSFLETNNMWDGS